MSPSEKALFTRRRKEAYEALHPETKNGTNQHSSLRQLGEPSTDRFTADTAKKTGESERNVQHNAECGLTSTIPRAKHSGRPKGEIMRLRTISALAFCCAMLAGCQTPPPSTPSQTTVRPTAKQTVKRQLTAEEIAVVQKGVRERLKDPDSARFGAMAATQEGDDHSWVCGTVNAKNSFGGYTGDKPYMGMLTHLAGGGKVLRTFLVSGMGGTDSETYAVLATCKQYGVL